MFCSGCGNETAAGEKFCQVCGKEIGVSAIAQATGSAPGLPQETSGKAIVSLVCGLFLFAFPMSILAIVFGHLSHSEIRKSAGRLKGDGMAITGMVLGYLGVAAIPVILIIAAIAIPNLLRARIAANESSAARAVRILAVAEVQYSAAHPETGYTCNLSDLAGAGMINGSLSSGQQAGYHFELLGCGATTEGAANDHFRVIAFPLTLNTTGRRAFCSDESAVIRMDTSGSPQDCMSTGAPL